MRHNPYFPLRSSRKKVPDTIRLRNITFPEAVNLRRGQTVYTLDRMGRAVQVRVASSVKQWKKDPYRIEISFKFGLYETFRLSTEEILSDIYVVDEDVGEQLGLF